MSNPSTPEATLEKLNAMLNLKSSNMEYLLVKRGELRQVADSFKELHEEVERFKKGILECDCGERWKRFYHGLICPGCGKEGLTPSTDATH